MTSSPATSSLNNSNDYWLRVRHPLTCLVFLAPLLAIYEAGVLWLGGHDSDAIRNGADFLMRDWLQQIGFHQAFLLPALVIALLLAWHVAGKYPWRVSADTLAGMFAESLLFAFALILLGQLQDLAFQHWRPPDVVSIGEERAARAVTFIGAGIYEEVMFRLCLLPIVFAVFRALWVPRFWAAALAVVATSLVFSAAHYIGPAADAFALFSFTFRAVAGLFFAALFCLRGFGITVGCHAAYDLLVGVLLTVSE